MSSNETKQAQMQQQSLSINVARQRTKPRTDFVSVLKTGMTRGLNVVGSTASLAIPGAGAVLSAAVSGVRNLQDSASSGKTVVGGNTVNLAGSGGGGSLGIGNNIGSTGVLGGGGTNNIGTTGGSSEVNSQMGQMQQMQEMNQTFNLQYLALQQKTQSDNREWSSLSNVMKTKHDTAKNAINNFR